MSVISNFDPVTLRFSRPNGNIVALQQSQSWMRQVRAADAGKDLDTNQPTPAGQLYTFDQTTVHLFDLVRRTFGADVIDPANPRDTIGKAHKWVSDLEDATFIANGITKTEGDISIVIHGTQVAITMGIPPAGYLWDCGGKNQLAYELVGCASMFDPHTQGGNNMRMVNPPVDFNNEQLKSIGLGHVHSLNNRITIDPTRNAPMTTANYHLGVTHYTILDDVDFLARFHYGGPTVGVDLLKEIFLKTDNTTKNLFISNGINPINGGPPIPALDNDNVVTRYTGITTPGVPAIPATASRPAIPARNATVAPLFGPADPEVLKLKELFDRLIGGKSLGDALQVIAFYEGLRAGVYDNDTYLRTCDKGTLFLACQLGVTTIFEFADKKSGGYISDGARVTLDTTTLRTMIQSRYNTVHKNITLLTVSISSKLAGCILGSTIEIDSNPYRIDNPGKLAFFRTGYFKILSFLKSLMISLDEIKSFLDVMADMVDDINRIQPPPGSPQAYLDAFTIDKDNALDAISSYIRQTGCRGLLDHAFCVNTSLENKSTSGFMTLSQATITSFFNPLNQPNRVVLANTTSLLHADPIILRHQGTIHSLVLSIPDYHMDLIKAKMVSSIKAYNRYQSHHIFPSNPLSSEKKRPNGTTYNSMVAAIMQYEGYASYTEFLNYLRGAPGSVYQNYGLTGVNYEQDIIQLDETGVDIFPGIHFGGSTVPLPVLKVFEKIYNPGSETPGTPGHSDGSNETNTGTPRKMTKPLLHQFLKSIMSLKEKEQTIAIKQLITVYPNITEGYIKQKLKLYKQNPRWKEPTKKKVESRQGMAEEIGAEAEIVPPIVLRNELVNERTLEYDRTLIKKCENYTGIAVHENAYMPILYNRLSRGPQDMLDIIRDYQQNTFLQGHSVEEVALNLKAFNDREREIQLTTLHRLVNEYITLCIRPPAILELAYDFRSFFGTMGTLLPVIPMERTSIDGDTLVSYYELIGKYRSTGVFFNALLKEHILGLHLCSFLKDMDLAVIRDFLLLDRSQQGDMVQEQLVSYMVCRIVLPGINPFETKLFPRLISFMMDYDFFDVNLILQVISKLDVLVYSPIQEPHHEGVFVDYIRRTIGEEASPESLEGARVESAYVDTYKIREILEMISEMKYPVYVKRELLKQVLMGNIEIVYFPGNAEFVEDIEWLLETIFPEDLPEVYWGYRINILSAALKGNPEVVYDIRLHELIGRILTVKDTIPQENIQIEIVKSILKGSKPIVYGYLENVAAFNQFITTLSRIRVAPELLFGLIEFAFKGGDVSRLNDQMSEADLRRMMGIAGGARSRKLRKYRKHKFKSFKRKHPLPEKPIHKKTHKSHKKKRRVKVKSLRVR
jgi:hypothetical protein